MLDFRYCYQAFDVTEAKQGQIIFMGETEGTLCLIAEVQKRYPHGVSVMMYEADQISDNVFAPVRTLHPGFIRRTDEVC